VIPVNLFRKMYIQFLKPAAEKKEVF